MDNLYDTGATLSPPFVRINEHQVQRHCYWVLLSLIRFIAFATIVRPLMCCAPMCCACDRNVLYHPRHMGREGPPAYEVTRTTVLPWRIWLACRHGDG